MKQTRSLSELSCLSEYTFISWLNRRLVPCLPCVKQSQYEFSIIIFTVFNKQPGSIYGVHSIAIGEIVSGQSNKRK